MKAERFVLAAMIAALVPTTALADDPNDPTMRSAAARARDHESIRQLNLGEIAMVQQRDAGYAQGWRDWRAPRGEGADDGYAARVPDGAMADYTRDRLRYDREMAAWRRAVAACRAGDVAACGG